MRCVGAPAPTYRAELQLIKKLVKYLKKNKSRAVDIIKVHDFYHLFCINEDSSATWKIEWHRSGTLKKRWEFKKNKALEDWTQSAMKFFC